MKLQLVVDVEYQPNGVSRAALVDNLERMIQRAVGDGALTGASAAEVESFSVEVSDGAHVRRDTDRAIAEHGGGDCWAEHPLYSVGEWAQEASDGNTRSGYWDWVVTQIDQEDDDEQEEL